MYSRLSKIDFCTSGLHHDERASIAAAAKALDINVVNEVTKECTHLVVSKVQLTAKFLTALINNAHIVTPQFVTALASATAPSSWPSEAAFQPKNVEVSYEVDLSPQPRRKTIFAKALLLFFTEKDVKQWSFLSAAGASIKEIATSVSPSAVASQYCALFERVYVFGTTATVNDPEWEKHMNDVHHIPPVVTYADQMHLAQLVPLPGTLSSKTTRSQHEQPDQAVTATMPQSTKRQKTSAPAVPPAAAPALLSTKEMSAKLSKHTEAVRNLRTLVDGGGIKPSPATEDDLSSFVTKTGVRVQTNTADMMQVDADELPRAGGAIVSVENLLVNKDDYRSAFDGQSDDATAAKNFKRFRKIWPRGQHPGEDHDLVPLGIGIASNTDSDQLVPPSRSDSASPSSASVAGNTPVGIKGGAPVRSRRQDGHSSSSSSLAISPSKSTAAAASTVPEPVAMPSTATISAASSSSSSSVPSTPSSIHSSAAVAPPRPRKFGR